LKKQRKKQKNFLIEFRKVFKIKFWIWKNKFLEVRDRLTTQDPYNRVIQQLRTAHLVALTFAVIYKKNIFLLILTN